MLSQPNLSGLIDKFHGRLDLLEFITVEGKSKEHTGEKLMQSEAQAAGEGMVV